MQETYNLLNHKVEQTHKQVEKINLAVKDLTTKIIEHDKDLDFLKGEKTRLAENIHSLRGFVNSTNLDNQLSIKELTIITKNLAESSDSVVKKLDNITTPKTIGFIMGGVVAFCGFVLGVIKLLNMI